MVDEHRDLGEMALFELLARQSSDDVSVNGRAEVEVAVRIEALLVGVFVYLLGGVFQHISWQLPEAIERSAVGGGE